MDDVDFVSSGFSNARSLGGGALLAKPSRDHESLAAHRVRELLALPAGGGRAPLERALIDADVEAWALDRHGQAEVLDRLAEEYSHTDARMEGHVCAAAERLRLLSLNAASAYYSSGGYKYVDAFALFEDSKLEAICEAGVHSSAQAGSNLGQPSSRSGVRIIVPPWVVRE